MTSNFVEAVLASRPGTERAIVELRRDGGRREWSFAELIDASARFAGRLGELGVGRGDVVMTCIGNRSEWVLSMLACFRIGAVALPCNEQLRRADIVHRLETADPAVVVADERNLEPLRAAGPECPVLVVPDDSLFDSGPPAPSADLSPSDPALITFTSGSTGKPKAVLHGQRYLLGQRVQAESWFGARPGQLAWCTAASGWSKSARNAFIAPWLCGATALLHDARFDPQERVEILARERVNVLCMAPTEYRVVAHRAELPELPQLRRLIAAGEALDAPTLEVWRRLTGLDIGDGYGQTETGQLTGVGPEAQVRPGSMGRPLPGFDVRIEDGELVVDPGTVPTFFLGYLGEAKPQGTWRTGDLVRADQDGYLYFEGRADDLIISSGYRISPDEVEHTLRAHPAVADVAVLGVPDAERGMVVKAVVVPAESRRGSGELARELQEHVKRETAPYKYPRILEWAEDLPRTSSGKLRRSALRDPGGETPDSGRTAG
jgi:acyl-coenzyme A synthetase/AMP-(fatty) acid ligase